jgi:uncharacterized repeat protein (TIGR01451 family)
VPTAVINRSILTVGDGSLQRSASVQLVPARARPRSRLVGSRKVASKHVYVSGERIDYAIRLHNSGTAPASVEVIDQIPAELAYVPGSARPPAQLEAGTRTMTWNGVVVPVGGDTSLTFSASAPGMVTVPMPVPSTATLSNADETLERTATILLEADVPLTDRAPPTVHRLTVGAQDLLSRREVRLQISASDDVGVEQMYLREWLWVPKPWPHWQAVQSSGWIPHQAEYNWRLWDENGAHYIGVWVADAAGNRSHLDGLGLDHASLVRPALLGPGQIAAALTGLSIGVVPYLAYYGANVEVRANLNATGGEATLYAWYTGAMSQPIVAAAQEATFTTRHEGVYLFLVQGQVGATYDLSIEPPGGPRQPASGSLETAEGDLRAEAQGATNAISLDGRAEKLISLFTESGIDPLHTAEVPGKAETVYLPTILSE